jgi:hypothetical protein
MPEGKRSLPGILDELHAALDEAPEIGEEGRAALQRAASEIEQALKAAPGDAPASLRDQLNEAVGRFEQSHPKLTSIVGRIADALSELGV